MKKPHDPKPRKSSFDNPTCNRCREKKNHLSGEDGEVYYRCGDCLYNPVTSSVDYYKEAVVDE